MRTRKLCFHLLPHTRSPLPQTHPAEQAIMEVSVDELMGFVSNKVFCPGNPKRNLALRGLAGALVRQANGDATYARRKARYYTMYFGPAGQVMLDALRDWFGSDTPRCWVKMAEVFDDCCYFSTFEAKNSTSAVRLHVGMLINETAAAAAPVESDSG